MRLLRVVAVTIWLLLAFTASASDSAVSLAQYIGTLEQLRASIQSAKDSSAVNAIADKLPQMWALSADGRTFSVPSSSVAIALRDYAKERTPTNLQSIDAQLDLLLSNARAMRGAKLSAASERGKLNDILARGEFSKVKGETWWDRLKAAAQRWLLRLSRLFGSSAFPVVSRVAVWVLVAAAVVVLALWVVRSYRQANVYTSFSGVPEAVSAKPWREWQDEAQAAAREGRWRDAVHLSYWAAISFLEGQGLWRPDRARTPREYLRLLGASDLHRDPLQQLTRTFEKVWYGTDPATADTFAGASALLERLGCR